MPKMHLHGITITVTEREIAHFKRAGYVIVEEPKSVDPEPEQPIIVVETDAPVAPVALVEKRGKKK